MFGSVLCYVTPDVPVGTISQRPSMRGLQEEKYMASKFDIKHRTSVSLIKISE